MFLAKIVFVAFICTLVTNFSFVAGENGDDELTEPPGDKKKEPSPPLDNHTFVALIDIVFSDGKKKTCTGTIIHDNVVITAAHCFVAHNPDVQAELTASFVVIGTKKMYDTGYENYLPIERIITHPKYKGWTADLALVYTFAGMTSDKPGNIMPLMGESALTPVDSNVTVLSWGHCKDELDAGVSTRADKIFEKRTTCDSSEDNDSCEPRTTTYSPLRAAYSSENQDDSSERDKSDSDMQTDQANTYKSSNVARGSEEDYSKIIRLDAKGGPTDTKVIVSHQNIATKSRYLTTSDSKLKKRVKKASSQIPRPPQTLKHRYKKAFRNSSYVDPNLLNVAKIKDPVWTGRQIKRRSFSKEEDIQAKPTYGTDKDEKEQNKTKEDAMQDKGDWRRSAGGKENKLTIEIFGFVNVQTCKKLVDKAMPRIYSINTNEVVCYAAEEHYISSEDSGAPAIRQGHLVAVTLGGVECEGDHVAIGIKMTCFCTWIAENLPSGGDEVKCCKDCCGEAKEETKYYRQRHVNHYLRNVRVDLT